MPDAIRCPACETLRPAAIGTTVGGTADREASSDAAGFISSTGFIFGSSVGDSSSFHNPIFRSGPDQGHSQMHRW